MGKSPMVMVHALSTCEGLIHKPEHNLNECVIIDAWNRARGNQLCSINKRYINLIININAGMEYGWISEKGSPHTSNSKDLEDHNLFYEADAFSNIGAFC